MSIIAFAQPLGGSLQTGLVNKALPPGNFLGTSNLHPLPPLERANEFAGLKQAAGRTGVELGKASAHGGYAEFASSQILSVDVCDLILAAI